MIKRIAAKKLKYLLKYFPVVALVGPRQAGKTTLARDTVTKLSKPFLYLDLEMNTDRVKLSDPETFLQGHQDQTLVLDEIQRMPHLFTSLRGLVDQYKKPARFLLLGSASPDIVKNSSETLAGRIAYLELTPLLIPELPKKNSVEELWLLGGFPDAFLGKIPHGTWMENFIRNYLERDLPMLGFPGNRTTAQKLWSMLAHIHGSTLNYHDLSRSLEVSSPTIKRYVDFLESAFLVRQLQPYYMNIGKRLVKAPKVYLRDSGTLHHLLNITDMNDLIGHPRSGASWEGFVIEQIASLMPDHCRLFFFRTHQGAELDLVIEKGGKPFAGIEIKLGSDIRPSKGNTLSVQYLGTKKNFIIVKGREDYAIDKIFHVAGIEIFLKKYLPEF